MIPNTPLRALRLLLVVVVTTPCLAQAPIGRRDRNSPPDAEGGTPTTSTSSAEMEESATPTAPAEERAPSFLGDTSRFSRYGGWGGIGGSMGQWGLSKSMLIMMPPVQDELELTDEQKQRLRDWMEQMRGRGEEFGKSLRNEFGEEFRQADVPLARRMFAITRMMSQVGGILQENEAGIDRILEPDQRRRLTQIALQMEGISALAKPEVARAINLSPTQSLRIQELLNQSRTSQLLGFLQQMPTMAQRGRGETPGPPRGIPNQQPGNAQAGQNPAPPTAPPGEPDEEAARRLRRQEGLRRFETMRQRSDAIQEKLTVEVWKVLTARQRKRFDDLLGEPFDPQRINQMTARPRGPESPATTEPRRGAESDL